VHEEAAFSPGTDCSPGPVRTHNRSSFRSCHAGPGRPPPTEIQTRRHAAGDRWFVDETDVKVAGRWRYLYRAVDQFGQVIDVLLSEQRDTAAARRFFTSRHAPRAGAGQGDHGQGRLVLQRGGWWTGTPGTRATRLDIGFHTSEEPLRIRL
jgi:DDE domain